MLDHEMEDLDDEERDDDNVLAFSQWYLLAMVRKRRAYEDHRIASP